MSFSFLEFHGSLRHRSFRRYGRISVQDELLPEVEDLTALSSEKSEKSVSPTLETLGQSSQESK